MNKNIFKDNSGVTMIEMLISAALSLVIVFQAQNIMRVVQKHTKQDAEEMEELMQQMLVDRVLLKDLREAALSLSVLRIEDDNNKDFYEISTSPCQNDCERKLTIKAPASAGAYSDPFYVIARNKKQGEKRVYEPSLAFTDPDPSNAFRVSFVSMNKGNILKRNSSDPELEFSPWVKENLVMMYMPEYRGVPGRRHTLIGRVSDDHTVLKPEDLQGMVKYRHVTMPSVLVDSTETFLRTTPMTTGLKSFVLIEPIEFIRYRLQTIRAPNNGGSQTVLLRGVYDKNGDFKERIIGSGTKKVVFSRTNISSPMINFALEE